MKNYYGKYRGWVTDNDDPINTARVQVAVPSVFGEGNLVWAMPCSPYAGSGVGFVTIPPVGANVWVEFEAGDSRLPIWAGCFWQEGELTPSQLQPGALSIIGENMSLTIDDNVGGIIVIENKSGARIELTSTDLKKIVTNKRES